MALAKERMRHNPQLSFDPSSPELLSSDQGYFDLGNASNIGFSSSLQHQRSTRANSWNYSSPSSSSSSSLLSFDQGDRFANSNHSNVAQEERVSQKRTYTLGDLLPSKKHCGNDGKGKARPPPSKDPQSIAAKNRRERISERLRTLQELVPNGTKVDLVTMLEKAISYVKFLQLQVKVLATDEFWPAQGGKAPEVSQVKEAIDAILSSHRERNSSNISKH